VSRRRFRHRNLGDERGFSLVELLVVMMLLVVVGGIVTTSVVAGLTASRRGQERVYALTDLETAAQRVAREARAAQPVIAANSNLLDLTVFREANGQHGRFRFRYELIGGDLLETRTWYSSPAASTPTSTVGPRPLIANLDQGGAPTFTFFRDDGVPWVVGDPPSDIARVRVLLRRDLPEQDPIEVETSVYVRNSA
jgi:prepilin-type N-terminal cleavage/methylation domain-containing protein